MVASLALVCSAQALAAYPPARNGQLYYASDAGHIIRVTPGVADQFDLTGVSGITGAAAPAVSPDGQKVAFESDGNVWVMNRDGTSPQDLTTDMTDEAGDPAFSPDGTKIVFEGPRVATPSDGSAIWSMTATGLSKTELTAGIGVVNPTFTFDGASHPEYTPDGTKIAFDLAPNPPGPGDGSDDIFFMNADGSSPSNFTDSPARRELGPTVYDSGPGFDLVTAYSIDTAPPMPGGFADNDLVYYAGGFEYPLTNPAYDNDSDRDVAFSADGDLIAYWAFNNDDGDNDRVIVRPADGTGTPITIPAATDPAWEYKPIKPPIGTRRILCAGKAVTIPGTLGKDKLNGTKGSDVIDGSGGADTINGKGGNDVICGGDGNDKLNGGAGKDKLLGQAGKDSLNGGAGKDKLVGGPGKDTQK